ncbi:MAG TPA: cytochrome c biogenesis protein CcsA [Candidatus Methanoperedenaceae archaeon]|nr:cytochrome c biogenesis protein CcsA [Candidatus Methanoperedenaceae archaeon]
MNFNRVLYGISALFVAATLYMILFYAPSPVSAISNPPGDPNSYKIAYFHIPIAITAYIGFFIVFLGSIMYILKKLQGWDMLALAAAEVGVVFAILTLVTGSIWANATWGYYWVPWDVRLNTSLVLFVIYVAYLMMRQAIEEPEKRARLSAVFGIIGFIAVPMSYLSIRLWTSSTLHPVAEYTFDAGSPMVRTFLISFTAAILLCLSLISLRYENEELAEKISETKRSEGL